MSSLLNNPKGNGLGSAIMLPRDRWIADREKYLVAKPADQFAAYNLFKVLENHVPSLQGIGKYSDCQRKFAEKYYNPKLITNLLQSGNYSGEYKNWKSLIHASRINPPFLVLQLVMGKYHSINDTPARCNERLEFFDKTKVISKLCFDCHKVQILSADLVGLMKTYFILRAMKLPRDNHRKCMVEVREKVPFPYKGYIYCGSEEEALFCRDMFRDFMEKYQVTDLRCNISHGCSEHGLEYSNFKYSKDGSYKDFPRPPEWDEIEAEFFANTPEKKLAESDLNKPGISAWDVFGFSDWIDYAEIIGDETWKLFRDKPEARKVGPLVKRIREQAAARLEQLHKLRASMAAEG